MGVREERSGVSMRFRSVDFAGGNAQLARAKTMRLLAHRSSKF